MNNNMLNERYDEIKNLLKKSRMLVEQDTQINVAKDLEKRISQDDEYETAVSDIENDEETSPQDKVQKYRISIHTHSCQLPSYLL